ncbi:Uncharacterized protein TCAP_05612 [Tolypocladium capitatum]|uniref:Uncharacterized protein n=1 Tax=Tolypocladium capitatum TaxID=45235 RepID=A0A2K3QA81_9HYPO|nr:Uncharacterized protein TCAP_05612 [Tolypocladium capitatum]
MWDVVWTDPSRELVGEHRARKQRDKETGRKKGDGGGGGGGGGGDDDEGSRARSGRSSLSTTSPRSSGESAFARFRARGLKHINTSKANASAKAAASPAPSSGLASKSRRSSGLSVTKTLDELRSVFNSPSTEETGRSSHGVSLDMSREGTWAAVARDKAARNVRRGAFARLRPAEPGEEGIHHHPEPQVRGTEDAAAVTNERVSTRSDHGCMLADPGSPLPRSTEHLVPPAKSPLRSRKPAGRAPSAARATMAEGPGDEPAAVPPTWRSHGNAWKPADFEALTQEVDVMGSSSPAVVLSRLKEISRATGTTTADDHRQLEMEKMRWMFSTLHHLDLAAPCDASGQPTSKIGPAEVHSILALYESKAAVRVGRLAVGVPDPAAALRRRLLHVAAAALLVGGPARHPAQREQLPEAGRDAAPRHHRPAALRAHHGQQARGLAGAAPAGEPRGAGEVREPQHGAAAVARRGVAARRGQHADDGQVLRLARQREARPAAAGERARPQRRGGHQGRAQEPRRPHAVEGGLGRARDGRLVVVGRRGLHGGVPRAGHLLGVPDDGGRQGRLTAGRRGAWRPAL